MPGGHLGGFLTFVALHGTMGGTSFGGFHPFVWSFPISLICRVTGSLMAPRQGEAHPRVYFGAAAETDELPLDARPQPQR